MRESMQKSAGPVQRRVKAPAATKTQHETDVAQSPRVVMQRKAMSDGFGGASAPVGGGSGGGGLPPTLTRGIAALSGMDLSDVKVHRNSAKPAQLKALAFAQNNEIHVGPGQENSLPHEAWHIVQQRQGRVKADVQMKGVGINDEPGLEQEATEMGSKALQHGASGGDQALARARPSSGGKTTGSQGPMQFLLAKTGSQEQEKRDKEGKSGQKAIKLYEKQKGGFKESKLTTTAGQIIDVLTQDGKNPQTEWEIAKFSDWLKANKTAKVPVIFTNYDSVQLNSSSKQDKTRLMDSSSPELWIAAKNVRLDRTSKQYKVQAGLNAVQSAEQSYGQGKEGLQQASNTFEQAKQTTEFNMAMKAWKYAQGTEMGQQFIQGVQQQGQQAYNYFQWDINQGQQYAQQAQQGYQNAQQRVDWQQVPVFEQNAKEVFKNYGQGGTGHQLVKDVYHLGRNVPIQNTQKDYDDAFESQQGPDLFAKGDRAHVERHGKKFVSGKEKEVRHQFENLFEEQNQGDYYMNQAMQDNNQSVNWGQVARGLGHKMDQKTLGRVAHWFMTTNNTDTIVDTYVEESKKAHGDLLFGDQAANQSSNTFLLADALEVSKQHLYVKEKQVADEIDDLILKVKRQQILKKEEVNLARKVLNKTKAAAW